VPLAVPRAAGLLRGAVPREGRNPHRARVPWLAEILAQDVQPEGSELMLVCGDFSFY